MFGHEPFRAPMAAYFAVFMLNFEYSMNINAIHAAANDNPSPCVTAAKKGTALHRRKIRPQEAQPALRRPPRRRFYFAQRRGI